MIATPMDVLKEFPIRKNKKQKQAFREAVQSYCEGLGYSVSTEKGSMGARNVVIGSPETAKYLVTAHYDTPAAMILPNLITPCSFWCFLGYQLAATALFLAIAAIPILPLSFTGLSDKVLSVIWLCCLYALLGIMMLGPANKNNANDNTSGVVTVLEVASSIPSSVRDQVCFILFDLEEAGMFGSAAYAKDHKTQVKEQIVLNFDCVGEGDYLLIIPTKKLRKNPSAMEKLKAVTCDEKKSLHLQEKGFSVYPSDHGNFPLAASIAALKKSKRGILYCDKIHTVKDTVLDEQNVIFLRDRLIALISGNAAE